MQDYYFLTIPQRPIAKSNCYGVRVIGSGKKARGIIYTTRDLEDYEMMIGKIANDVIPETINTYTSIYVRVYQHGKRFIDLDNTLKAIQDGLDTTKTIKRGKNELRVCDTGIANDKYVQLIIAERYHVESKDEERVELILSEYSGLFSFVDVIKKHYDISEDYYNELFLPEI